MVLRGGALLMKPFSRNLNRWSDKSLCEAAAEEFGESPGGLLDKVSARGKEGEAGRKHSY